MPPNNEPRIPKYRLHKPSGKAVVRLNGKDFYLGVHGTPESQRAYDQIISEWTANNRQLPAHYFAKGSVDARAISVSQLLLAYFDFARTYYVKNGRVTGEVDGLLSAVKDLFELYPDLDVDEFTPLRLKAVREQMIGRGWCRNVVNQQVHRIKRIFKWGVENELVPPVIYEGLRAVTSLRRGRCEARETDPVTPAPQEFIEGALGNAPKPIAAMINLQLLTGMRPGEVVAMRPCDIERAKDAWAYIPMEHKTEHHGYKRRVLLGPKAQAVLEPFMDREPDQHLFSPREAMQERRRKRHKTRKVPLHCGNRPGTNRRIRPRCEPGDAYTVTTYRRAVAYACSKAFPWPALGDRKLVELTEQEKTDLKAWDKDHRFHPHQLRHNAATLIRQKWTLDAARAVLGHNVLATTETYAEMDQNLAKRVALDLG